MEINAILNKLKNMDLEARNVWKSWSLEERKKLLEIYSIFCQKEPHIYDLIYKYHDSDHMEDIFRDYDTRDLENKACGVEIAVNNLTDIIEENK